MSCFASHSGIRAALADRLKHEGEAGFADYGVSTTRLQLNRKDPQGYKTFLDFFQEGLRGWVMDATSVAAGGPSPATPTATVR